MAIYDAVNPLAAGRKSLEKEFAKFDVQVRGDDIMGRFLSDPSSSFSGLIFSPDYESDLSSLIIQTLFIESACDDERIIEENVRSVKISSPDVSL